ncbi:MAG: hypothetical protein H0V73_11790 [Chloroflexi bacterium]|nr:hypothetical protein [Chloroflexota bacterium]
MQVIASSRIVRPPLAAVAVGVVVGSLLLLGGLFLAWVAFATPIFTGMSPTAARIGPSQMAIGGLVWAFTLVGPPSFAIVGAIRLGLVARALTAKPAVRAMNRVADQLGDEYVVATDVRLDGRVLRNLVLGPFGLAVVNELPPPAVTRHAGFSWEVQKDGRWAHMENPMQRTTRDAERVRRWFSATERDYVVRVYAAIVSVDSAIVRTPTCAVVTAEQIPAWLASLPPSRALTPDRRAELVEQLRTIA